VIWPKKTAKTPYRPELAFPGRYGGYAIDALRCPLGSRALRNHQILQRSVVSFTSRHAPCVIMRRRTSITSWSVVLSHDKSGTSWTGFQHLAPTPQSTLCDRWDGCQDHIQAKLKNSVNSVAISIISHTRKNTHALQRDLHCLIVVMPTKTNLGRKHEMNICVFPDHNVLVDTPFAPPRRI
jgi:hypothetical protein